MRILLVENIFTWTHERSFLFQNQFCKDTLVEKSMNMARKKHFGRMVMADEGTSRWLRHLSITNKIDKNTRSIFEYHVSSTLWTDTESMHRSYFIHIDMRLNIVPERFRNAKILLERRYKATTGIQNLKNSTFSHKFRIQTIFAGCWVNFIVPQL